MQIPVVIEPVARNGFRARGGEPFPFTAEGATPEEALENLSAQLKARLKKGAVVVPLEVSTEPHPLTEFAGMFKDDPYFEEVLEIMAANRRRNVRGPRKR